MSIDPRLQGLSAAAARDPGQSASREILDRLAALEREVERLRTMRRIDVGPGPPTVAAPDGTLYVDTVSSAPITVRLWVRANGTWYSEVIGNTA